MYWTGHVMVPSGFKKYLNSTDESMWANCGCPLQSIQHKLLILNWSEGPSELNVASFSLPHRETFGRCATAISTAFPRLAFSQESEGIMWYLSWPVGVEFLCLNQWTSAQRAKVVNIEEVNDYLKSWMLDSIYFFSPLSYFSWTRFQSFICMLVKWIKGFAQSRLECAPAVASWSEVTAKCLNKTDEHVRISNKNLLRTPETLLGIDILRSAL